MDKLVIINLPFSSAVDTRLLPVAGETCVAERAVAGDHPRIVIKIAGGTVIEGAIFNVRISQPGHVLSPIGVGRVPGR